MTHSELHSIKDFEKLQTDPRFVSLIEYMRQHRPRSSSPEPHGMIHAAGMLEQHCAFIDMMTDVFTLPSSSPSVLRTRPYTGIPLPTTLPSQENNIR